MNIYVPKIEEFAFNFRRSLVHKSDMQKNLKYFLEFEHLKALNLDCIGADMGDTLMKMSSYCLFEDEELNRNTDLDFYIVIQVTVDTI